MGFFFEKNTYINNTKHIFLIYISVISLKELFGLSVSSIKFLGPKYETKIATRELFNEKCSVQTFIAFETWHFSP